MPPRERKPGDQAPPFRPTHRNPGKTSTTHIKDPAGKLYRVHDGTGETVIDPASGAAFYGLSYDDARRGKDFAVTKLKMRQAGIKELDASPMAENYTAVFGNGFAGPGGGGGGGGGPRDSFNKPSADPHVEALRKKAVAAAAPVAAAAQARANAKKAPKLAAVPKPPIVGIDPIAGDEEDLAITDDDDQDLSDADVADLLNGDGDLPSDDIARARAQAEADAAQLEADGKALYEQECALGVTGAPAGTKVLSWEALGEDERQAYRWQAANPQPASAS